MAKIQFPLQFERQYSNPIDIDMVFETTTILNSYLTDDKRYAGMIVTCKEQEGKIFVLNNAKNEWLILDSALYEKVANKVTTFNNPTDTQYPSAKLVKDYVDAKVSTVYKPQGSLAFNDLVVGLLVAANNGFVYNITEAFTTNEYFVDGAGKSHSAGTNVVIIEHSGNYKFDVLGGTVDLTPYELQSNKVSSWSETTNDTRYPSEKLVKDSLVELENTIQGVSDLSPYHYEGTFIGGDISQNDFDNLIVAFEDLREGTEFNETKLQGSYFVCSADSSFYFNTPYHWSASEGTGLTSAITYTWAAPYDLNGLTEINMKAGDIISILEFSYNSVSNTISTLIKVEKNPEETFVVKNESITPATKAKITYDAKGLVTAGADLIADDIPALPQSKITDLVTDLGNKQAALTFDSSPTSESTNPVTSGGVFDALAEKLNANKSAVVTVGGLVTPSVAPTVVEIVGIDATGAQVRIQVDTNDFEIDGSTSPYTLKKKEETPMFNVELNFSGNYSHNYINVYDGENSDGILLGKAEDLSGTTVNITTGHIYLTTDSYFACVNNSMSSFSGGVSYIGEVSSDTLLQVNGDGSANLYIENLD